MSSIVDKYTIRNEKLDRRVKLTKEQKEQIKQEYVHYDNYKKTNGENIGSIHWLANKYNVSRRLISSIVKNKEIKQINYKDKKDFPSNQTDYRTQKTKEHREYKKILYLDRLLFEQNQNDDQNQNDEQSSSGQGR